MRCHDCLIPDLAEDDEAFAKLRDTAIQETRERLHNLVLAREALADSGARLSASELGRCDDAEKEEFRRVLRVARRQVRRDRSRNQALAAKEAVGPDARLSGPIRDEGASTSTVVTGAEVTGNPQEESDPEAASAAAAAATASVAAEASAERELLMLRAALADRERAVQRLASALEATEQSRAALAQQYKEVGPEVQQLRMAVESLEQIEDERANRFRLALGKANHLKEQLQRLESPRRVDLSASVFVAASTTDAAASAAVAMGGAVAQVGAAVPAGEIGAAGQVSTSAGSVQLVAASSVRFPLTTAAVGSSAAAANLAVQENVVHSSSSALTHGVVGHSQSGSGGSALRVVKMSTLAAGNATPVLGMTGAHLRIVSPIVSPNGSFVPQPVSFAGAPIFVSAACARSPPRSPNTSFAPPPGTSVPQVTAGIAPSVKATAGPHPSR
mmetsp:Transcript_132822/g.425072  ORF Transcript_132822/g.425072 Transcript_132822/m.425072 type:complete len:445 (-) Transcript_132822:499-1833(-)